MIFAFALIALSSLCAYSAEEAAAPIPALQAASTPELESVLSDIDKASVKFKTAEADFVWEQYQRVVDETDVQKGKIYFRRRTPEMQMAASITVPDKKYLLFTDGVLRFYQPRIEQVTEYSTGNKRAEVESFLVLGFGGGGHDMQKAFSLRFAGYEMLDGVRVAKLELTPKAERVRGMFARIVLWVDTTRSVSLKQQFFEPSGDYRTATYSGIRVNEKVSDEAFKLKTTGKTKVVRPQ